MPEPIPQSTEPVPIAVTGEEINESLLAQVDGMKWDIQPLMEANNQMAAALHAILDAHEGDDEAALLDALDGAAVLLKRRSFWDRRR